MNDVIRKLKIKDGSSVLILNMPEELSSVFASVQPVFKASAKKNSFDQVICFCANHADVDTFAVKGTGQIVFDGMLWLCYPKGSAKVKTDINRDKGWEAVTERGFTGVTLISINDTWSAMRYRPTEMVGK